MDCRITKDATPEEARAEWVRWLESGEFPQTTGTLHHVDGGYCCLGVAAELCVAVGIATSTPRGRRFYYNVGEDDYAEEVAADLSETMQKFFDVSRNGKYVNSIVHDEDDGLYPTSENTLIESNDTWHRDFKYIAGQIKSGNVSSQDAYYYDKP